MSHRTFDESGVLTKKLILYFSAYDLNRVIADQEELLRYIPHRHEMEQLTAIVYEDPQKHIIVGYKDITENEFWVRGHMPGLPLMPGVLMCEAAAQICSYYTRRHDLGGSHVLGLGGMDNIRFRDVVRPGSRLVIVIRLTKIRPRAMVVCRFQNFVEQSLVCEGLIKGVPLPDLEDRSSEQLAARTTGDSATGDRAAGSA